MCDNLNTGNEVRRILMNELGLTREYIRGICDDIIKDTILKYMSTIVEKDLIDKLVAQEIKVIVSGGNRISSRSSIQQIVEQEAQAQVKEFIKTNLKIGV
jgi:hypothetical protein